MLATELAALFARDLTRLRQQLEAFPDTAAVWATAPGVSNVAGTLALHLEGNLREFVGRQLGHIDYQRDRPAEFGTRGMAQSELVARAAALADDIPPVIAALSDAALSATFPEVVLGAPISTRQFLIHLNGHLNYHLGQIDYLRRVTTGHGAIAL
ncbi:MAG: DinB family protein, partial [Acidobacteriota bacterium]|nr:DinB family protein [Acidobacteriota bacterium]